MIKLFKRRAENDTDKSNNNDNNNKHKNEQQIAYRPRTWSQGTMSTACNSIGISNKDFHISLDSLSDPHIVTPCNTLKVTDFKDFAPFAEGTNSILYKARVDTKYVIIKMIKKDRENDATAIREFDMERSILECANHPNIVRYLGAGDEPRRFIVMEYISHGTLGMVSNTNVSFHEAIRRARDLASALYYLHSQCKPGVCIIHRDLKPDNIGISDGTIKLFDFGLGISVKSHENASEAYEMTGMTGTLRYMAPEVAQNQPYNEKVDVYSFGIILWQMVANRVPFRKATRTDFMECVVKQHYRPPMHPIWSEQFTELLQACWNPNPGNRLAFSQILLVLDALANFKLEDSNIDVL